MMIPIHNLKAEAVPLGTYAMNNQVWRQKGPEQAVPLPPQNEGLCTFLPCLYDFCTAFDYFFVF